MATRALKSRGTSKFGPARVARVLEGLAKGHTLEEACGLAKISTETWRRWRKADEALPVRADESSGAGSQRLFEREQEARQIANAARAQVHHEVAIGERPRSRTITTVVTTETKLRKVAVRDAHGLLVMSGGKPLIEELAYEATRTVETIAETVGYDLRAIEWELERADRKNYAARTRVEVTGEDGGPVVLGLAEALEKVYGGA